MASPAQAQQQQTSRGSGGAPSSAPPRLPFYADYERVKSYDRTCKADLIKYAFCLKVIDCFLSFIRTTALFENAQHSESFSKLLETK